MVDQDRPIDNPLTQPPSQTLTPEEERNNLLLDYYKSSFTPAASQETSIREAIVKEEEERQEFNEILRNNGLSGLTYRAYRQDITDITGLDYQGLTAESFTEDKFAREERLRDLQMDIGTGGATFAALDVQELGARTGAFGWIDSIRANVNDAQAIIGLGLLTSSLSDETKGKLAALRADLDNTYGADPYAAQFVEGLKGLDPTTDYTGRPKQKMQEARDIIASDPNAPIDGQYTHDWLWSTLTSDPILEQMLSKAGVTKENSLAFSESDSGAFVKGIEAVSRRLYEHQLILEQIELSNNTEVNFMTSLKDMLMQDPDMAPELGIEILGGLVTTGVSLASTYASGGLAGPAAGTATTAYWTAFTTKWAARAGKIANKARKVKEKLEKLERLKGGAETFSALQTVGRATNLLLKVRPGSLSTFGNIADLILDANSSYTRLTKGLLWAGAQGLDGAVGGLAANTYSNMERKSILSTLYNEGEDISLLDNAGSAVVQGALASIVLGGAFKGIGATGSYTLNRYALGNKDITIGESFAQSFGGQKQISAEDRLKNKKELWMRVYGDSADSMSAFDKASKAGFRGWLRGEDVGTKVFLAGARQRARANVAVSLLTDGQVTTVAELRSKFGFTDGLNNTIFEADLDKALMQIIEETTGDSSPFKSAIDDGSFEGFGATGLRAKLLENNEFMSSLRNKDGELFSDADVKKFKEKQYGLLAAEEEALGQDPELQAILKSGADAETIAAEVTELFDGRIAETKQNLESVEAEAAEVDTKLDEDDAVVATVKEQVIDFLTGSKSAIDSLLKTDSGRRQLQTILSNFEAAIGVEFTADAIAEFKLNRKVPLTEEQKARLDELVALKGVSFERPIPTAESSFDDIKLYAESNGISFDEKVIKNFSNKKKKLRRKIIRDLQSSNPEKRKQAFNDLQTLIEAEEKDTIEILDRLGQLQDNLDEKIVELGNTEKRQTKRQKAKDITEQKRKYLQERLENLEKLKEEHEAGRFNIDPNNQGDIPTNAGFRDKSTIIEEEREVELNKNYDKYSIEVLTTKALLDAYEKADGTVSQALARQMFRRFLPKDHELLKKKKLDEGDMRQLLKEAQEAIDERTVNDMDIQNSIAGDRTLYDTADIEADFELGQSQARQANSVLAAMLDNVKMGDPSRFVAPRIRSDLEADLDTRNARATASRADYDINEDLLALNAAILKLKNLMAKPENASKGNAGTGTRAAIMSLFKEGRMVKDEKGLTAYVDEGALSDIDIDAVFGEALTSQGSTREFDLFNLEKVLQIMERRRDLGVQYVKTRELAEEINEKYAARYAAINEAISLSKSRVESLTKRAIGKEPLEAGETIETVKEALKQEREALDKLRNDRSGLQRDMEIEQAPTKASANKTPQQLRLEQSQLLTELRKVEAQEAKNKAGTEVRGADTEEQYVDRLVDRLVELSKSRGDNLAKSSLANVENARAYIEAEVIPYLPISAELKAKGYKALAVFGNGELDFQTPDTMAAAVRSLLRDNVDGSKRYEMEVTEFDEDKNIFVTEQLRSEEVKDFSAVQPGTDKQIAKILDQIIYEDKVRRINELDFDDPNGPSEADILKFIQDGDLTQNMSTAQDRASLTIHADQIPPPLRTDLDRVESIEAYINRTVEQMLDLPPSHYSFIHDDLKALPGQFGIRMEDVNTRAYFRYNIEEGRDNPWAQADPSGGFPVAIPLADPDNNYSIAHAILDASAWLYPEMTPEILRAFDRGEDIAKAAKGSKARGSRLISQADGTANGTKHGVAESIVFKRRVALFDALKSDKPEVVKGALELVKDLVEADGSTDIDFYQNLTYEIGAELPDKAGESSMSLGVRRALYAMNNADPERPFWVRGSKAGRSFSKKPLMIVPYNAKRKAVKAAVKSFFDDPDNAMYKNAMLAQAKQEGVTYDQVVEELTTAMIGGRDRALMNLVEKATGIPDAKGRMKSVLEPNGLRDSLLPKAITNDKLEWNSPAGIQVMLDKATDLAKIANKNKTPTAKEVDVIFRALQIEAFALAMLRKKEFDQVGTIPGIGEKLQQAKSPETMDDAMDIARLRFMQELTIIDKLQEARNRGDELQIKELESLITGSKFTFFDRTTQALNRTAFTVSRDDPSVKHVLKMTGQDAEGMSPSRALENTEDAIYINNLIDWRSRFVAPHTKEMDHKGEKSRRVILDPVQFVEESDATFKTSEAEAREDLELVELYANNPDAEGALSHSDWYAKHVDQGKAFAGGIYDIKDRGSATKREQIANRIKHIAKDETQLREEWTKINQQLAKKGEPVLSPDASVDDIIAAATKLEEIRIRRLALKNALITISPEFDAPLQKTADGTLVQTPPMTREEAFKEWRRQSDDIEASAQRIKDNEVDTTDEEYRKRFGNPWSSNYDSNGNLRIDELENPELQQKLNDRELKNNTENSSIELTPQTPRTMGGGLGFRAIHPTQHIDNVLGVPALREAHQVKTMGYTQELGKGTEEEVATLQRRLSAERDTATIDTNLEEKGLLFDIDERNRVEFTDAEFLADVDITVESLARSETLGVQASPEQTDVMVKDVLTKHARKYGLDDLLGEEKTVTETISEPEMISVRREIPQEDTRNNLEKAETLDLSRETYLEGRKYTKAKLIEMGEALDIEIPSKIKKGKKEALVDHLLTERAKSRVGTGEFVDEEIPTGRTIQRTVTRVVEKTEPRWDLIYGHQVWLNNIIRYNDEVDRFNKMLNSHAKKQNLAPNELEKRREAGLIALQEKWQKVVDARVEDFETTANNPYDSNQVDPYQNIRTFKVRDEEGNRLTLREALLSVSEDERRRSNVGLVDEAGSLQGNKLDTSSQFSAPAPTREEDIGYVRDERTGALLLKTPDGRIVVKDPTKKGKQGERIEEAGVLNVKGFATPKEGFDVGYRAENGEYIDIDKLTDNEAFVVSITHAKDASVLRKVVQNHMSELYPDQKIKITDGLIELTLRPDQAKRLMESVKSDPLIPNAEKNVRFTIDGLEIMSGRIIGHQTRRIASANQSRHVLQISANRYVGDMLFSSSLANNNVKRVTARHAKMDSHLKESRDFHTNLENENQLMLGFLERNAEPGVVSRSSFHQTRYIDLKKMWDDESFRDRVIMSTLVQKEIAAKDLLGVEDLNLISPYQVTASRLNTLDRQMFDPTGEDRLNLKEGKETVYLISVKQDGEPVEYVALKELREALGVKSLDDIRMLSGLDDIEPLTFGAIMAGRPRTSKTSVQKEYITASDFKRIKKAIDARDSEIREGEQVFGRNGIDKIQKLEGLTDAEVKDAKRLAGLVFINPKFINMTILNNPTYARAYGIEPTPNVLAAAQEIVASQKILQHGIDIAASDGVTRQGYAPIALRMLQEDPDLQTKILKGEELSNVDYQKLYEAWLKYEPGRPGSPELRGARDIGNIKDGASVRQKDLKRLIDEGVQIARQVMLRNEQNPYKDGLATDRPLYRGEYPDKADGTPGDAEYFMNKTNFRQHIKGKDGLPSEAHKAVDEKLETLVKSGTLTVRELKMLRAVLAQMDGDLLENLDFFEVDNIKKRAIEIAEEQGIDAPNFGGRSPAGFVNTSKTGIALHLLKGRLGRELTAVDVILHEIGHAAQVRLYDHGSPEWHMTNSMLNNPEAPELVKRLVLAMNNGVLDGKSKRQIEFYLENPDEFVAALFSYNMQARTFKDRATMEAAYKDADEIVPGSASTIKNIVQKMINFSYSKILHIRDVFLKLDPSYRNQIDAITDVLLGKAQMPLRDVGDAPPSIKFNTGSTSKMAEIAALKKEREMLIYEFGQAKDSPQVLEIDKAIEELESDIADGLRPSDYTEPKLMSLGAKSNMNEHRIQKAIGADGKVDFQKLIDDDPKLAMAFLAKHVLPRMKSGEYTDLRGETYSLEELYNAATNSNYVSKAQKLTKGQRAKRVLDSFALFGSNTEHTINSDVQLTTGDAKYMLVQMISELMDNNSLSSSSTFNGNKVATFSQISDNLDADLNVRMAFHKDKLRAALFRTTEQKAKGRNTLLGRSRILNENTVGSDQRAAELDEAMQLAGKSVIPGKAGDEARARIAEMKKDDDPRMQEVGNILEEMAEELKLNSEYVQDLAYQSGMLRGVTIDISGPVPLKLKLTRKEMMEDKGSSYDSWASALSNLFERKMLSSIEDSDGSKLLDVQTLVAAGILPIEDVRKASIVKQPLVIYNHLVKLSELDTPLIDKKQLDSLYNAGYFNEGGAFHQSMLDGDTTLSLEFMGLITDEGLNRYKSRISSFEGAPSEIRDYFSVLKSTIDARDESPAVTRLNKEGGGLFEGTADVRQYLYTKKTVAKNSVRFDPGDLDYLQINDVFEDPTLADMLDYNPVILSSGMARGIGADAADSLNFTRAIGNTIEVTDPRNPDRTTNVGVKNLNTRTIVKALEGFTEQVPMEPETKEALRKSLEFFGRARENLLGYRSSFDKSDAFYDTGLAFLNPLTFAFHGFNMPAALIQETSASALPLMRKALTHPIAAFGLIGKSLTAGLRPIEKARALKQTSVVLQTLRAEAVSRSNINLEVDVREHELGGQERNPLQKAAKLTVGLIGKVPQMMINANKELAASGAHDALIDAMTQGKVIKLIDELQAVRKQAEVEGLPELDMENVMSADAAKRNAAQRRFKQATTKAGIDYDLALELQRSGLLDPELYPLLEASIKNSNAEQTRFIDYARTFKEARLKGRKATELNRKARIGHDMSEGKVSDLTRKARELRKEGQLQDRFRNAMNTFVQYRIDSQNVEPRLFDRPLLNNTGFNAFQNIYMSWVRAFYEQKTFIGGGRLAAQSIGKLFSLYMNALFWDTAYSTLMEMARGKSTEQVYHEATNDPVGFTAKKVARLPVFGGKYGTAALGYIAQELQRSTVAHEVLGKHIPGRKQPYYTNDLIPFDPFGSPAEGVFNKALNAAGDIINVAAETAVGDNIAYSASQQSQGSFLDYVPVLNSMFLKIYRDRTQVRTPREEMRYQNMRNMNYLDMDQVMKHNRQKVAALREKALREMQENLERFRQGN